MLRAEVLLELSLMEVYWRCVTSFEVLEGHVFLTGCHLPSLVATLQGTFSVEIEQLNHPVYIRWQGPLDAGMRCKGCWE